MNLEDKPDKMTLQVSESDFLTKASDSPTFTVNALPVELLAKIMLFCKPTPYLIPWYDYIREANVCSHVCAHWRTVALSTPALWNDFWIITHALPAHNAEMLRRTHSATLSVDLRVVYLEREAQRVALDQMMDFAGANLGRVHKLKLVIPSPILSLHLGQLHRPAPALRHLELDGGDLLGSTSSIPQRVAELSPHVLEGRPQPSLSTVKLTSVRVDWLLSPWLANLVDFQLRLIPLEARPSYRQLIDILRRMPHLQQLEITDAIPVFTSDDQSHAATGLTRVNLLHLQRLVLQDQSCDPGPLSIDLIFPSTTQITLEDGRAEHTHLIFDCVRRKYADDSQNVRAMIIRSRFASTRVTVFNSMPSSLDIYKSEEVGAAISIPTSDTLQAARIILTNKVFPLSRLEALKIEAYEMDSSAIWIDAFADSPLETIIADRRCVWGLLTALQTRHTELTEDTFLPRLRELTVRRVDVALGSSNWYAFMHDTLPFRSTHGLPLHCLKIQNCRHVTQTDVDRIRALGTAVIWDKEPTAKRH